MCDLKERAQEYVKVNVALQSCGRTQPVFCKYQGPTKCQGAMVIRKRIPL
jgi:hypothetical protein